MKCCQHPGRESKQEIYGKHYCDKCVAGIDAARNSVDIHVQPKECFIWYQSSDNWQPIFGTGCAHWVAHQLDIHSGGQLQRCLAGFTYKIPELITGKQLVVNTLTKIGKLSDVKINDIYVMPSMHHTGLVFKIDQNPNSDPTIWIRHDSSGQHRLAENQLSFFAHGNGSFYR